MAGDTLGEVIRRLSRFGGLQGDLTQTDAQLLDRFARRREEPAFAALLARHGPMVLGLCRRLLHDPRDAEDAFQAAFLILARKAGVIRRQALLGAWLYGVAWRVAVRLRGRIARRRERERPVLDLDALPADDAGWSEARWVVHEEVQRLPEVYRSAVILCCLEGKTNEEAARLLRRPVGTVKSRLTRGREILRSRLTRRGLVVSAGGVGAAVAVGTAPASAALVDATVRAALPFAAGGAVAGGVVSARAVALSQGVLRTMFLKKLSFAAALALAVALLGGTGGLAYHSWAAAPGNAPKRAASADKPPAADQPKDGATKDKPKDDADAEKIQGTWVVVSEERDGKAMPAEAIGFLTVGVTADKVAFIPNGIFFGRSPYKLDPAKTPKVIELTPPDGPWKGTTVHCLYKLDGDDLKLCFLIGPGEEPKEFATTPGSNLRLLILKRKPADDKPADKPKDDKEAIQGVWRITTIVMGGKEQDDAQARVEKEERYVFTAERFVIRYEIQENSDQGPRITQESVYTYDLDPTRTPKVLDVWPQYAPFKGKVVRGVYSLEGDVLKLCQALGVDGKRPKEVASKEGDQSRLLILRRVKPDDDRDAIQGAWKVESVRVAGQDVTDQDLAGRGIKVWREWVVRGDAVEFGDDAVHYSCPYRLDATTDPREIDLDPMLPGYTADRKKGPPNRGVYRLDGDEWQVCFPRGTDLAHSSGADVKRPTEVASVKEAEGTPPVGTMLITLKRVKEGQDKPKDDAAAIQGLWRVTTVERDGKEQDDEEARKIREQRWEFRPNGLLSKLNAAGNDIDEYLFWVYEIHPQRTPKTIDLELMHQDVKVKEPTLSAIYSLDGGVLKICLPLTSDARATELATREGGKTVLLTLRRVKPDQDKANDQKPPQAKTPDGAHSDIIADAIQPAGSPVLLKFVLTNTGKQPLTYWVGGPADYPPINIPARVTDAAGKTREAPLSNGQALGGSGLIHSLGPGDSVTTPAAMPPLAAGDYRIEVGDGSAMITVKDDPELLKKRADNLLTRIRNGEPFAQHAAAAYLTPSLRDKLLEMLSVTDGDAAWQAAQTLHAVEKLPADAMPLVAKAMDKQLAFEESQHNRNTNVLIYLADIAARIGTDEALDAELKLAHSDLGMGPAVRALGMFKQERAVQALHDFLKSDDKDLRYLAAMTLADHRDSAAVDALLDIIADGKSSWRGFACLALAKYPDDPRVEPAVRSLLEDREAADQAKEALEQLHAAQKK